MKKLRFCLLMVAMLLAVTVAAQAATYGYVIVEGRKLKDLRREVFNIEQLVKGWPNGEMLQTIEVEKGLIFKRHKIFVIFAGNSSNISSFLTKAPYAGDFLKNITVRYVFGKIANGEKKAEKVGIYTKKFPNIRKALEANVGKTAPEIASKLKMQNPGYTHATVTFYSLQADPENQLFQLVDDNTLVKGIDFDAPMIPGPF